MNFNEMSSNTAVADVPHLQNLQLEAFSQGNFQLAQRLSRSAIDIALGNALVLRERRESCEVSLIVVSYQCNDLTLELLEELAGFRFSFSHELILVLNNDEKLKALLNDRLFEKFVILDCPHNLGASGGRNAGAKLAKGRYLVFLDDDGFTRQSDIEALHEMAVQYDATGVRGRVLPRDGVTTPPTHYDMGDHLLPSIMDIEGITLWNRERFQLIGGFDELLFGHEGFELYARLYPRYGPCSFLYCPNARLIHDYSTPSKPNEAKQARYARNMAYLKWKGTPHTELLRSISRFRNDPIERSIFYSSLSEMLDIVDHQDNAADELVSVITTAKDAATFLADYTATLKAQTHQNFELIFIDDHSTDGTSQMISDLWSNDERLIYVKNDRTGRASALNLALSKARGEICVIADADDLMVPNRIRWSVRHLQNGDCVSGYIFNEEAAIRGTRPFVDQPTDIRLRRFAGMPVSFPSFAFKKARFRLPFDESLDAGIDCDWLHRNFRADPTITGTLVPFHTTYYRLHDGQITTGKRSIQMEVGYKHVAELHTQFIDFDEQVDRDVLLQLMGWMAITSGSQIGAINAYVQRFYGSPQADRARSYLSKCAEGLHHARLKQDYAAQKNQLGRANDRIKELQSSGLYVSSKAEITNTTIQEPSDYQIAEDSWVESMIAARRKWTWPLSRKLPQMPAHFDDQTYLAENPDVRASVKKGRFVNGLHHFALHGRREGRRRPLL